jgi:hypothetical protein
MKILVTVARTLLGPALIRYVLGGSHDYELINLDKLTMPVTWPQLGAMRTTDSSTKILAIH